MWHPKTAAEETNTLVEIPVWLLTYHICARFTKYCMKSNKIIKFLLVMQIAITILFLKCLGLYCTWSQYHPGDDNLYSCYVIFLLDNDVSRRIKKLLSKFSMAQDHLSPPSNELHLYPLHSLWLMDPFFHHTNQTLLLWSENIHNTVNELVVESFKFQAEQQNYMWQSIFISGHAVFQIRGSQVKNVSLITQYGQI